jgi:hypothetical protein
LRIRAARSTDWIVGVRLGFVMRLRFDIAESASIV